METFKKWLEDYGKYWENKEPDEFGLLFSDDAIYKWTPFDTPLRGRTQIIQEVTRAISTQSEIDFHYEVLSFDGIVGLAHWTCHVTRTISGRRFTLDGILAVGFDDEGKCNDFKEWWHSNEHE